ncbi:MAG TPA: aromatic-ring-hydroxylating dioxygenase subunit beta [Bacillales bacterium]|nr:aromatic-ring-hydroxylating dioxygenase subunit beta [Bacillales bacterium]
MKVVQDKMTEDVIASFLYKEADLLDSWRLDEWLHLFTEESTYTVPATDMPNGNPQKSLAFIADDYSRLKARVKRLSSKFSHAENPRSRTRRFITNVQIQNDENGKIDITANFIVYRMRYGFTDAYVGKYYYTLLNESNELKILNRKAVLDLEGLRPHSRISIIL